MSKNACATLLHRSELEPSHEKLLKEKFINHYRVVYKNAKQEDVEFPLDLLDTWLEEQFHSNGGENWIVLETDFLTFTETEESVAVFHLVASSTAAKILLLKKLAALDKKKKFVTAVRKSDTATVNTFTKIGCKVVENEMPSYSSTHYHGIEIPPSLGQKLGYIPTSVLKTFL